MTSSKERLRQAHQLLDKQLQNSSFSRKLKSQTPDSTNFWSLQGKKQTNGKSDISELQKKLMDLQRKMENISCSSQADDNDIFIRKNSRQKQRPMINLKNSQKPGLSEDEDSADENQIYCKLQIKKQKSLPKKPISIHTKKQNTHPKPSNNIMKQSKGSLRDSCKSIKSRKSNFSQTSINNSKKLIHSHSRSSIGSRKSTGLNKSQLRNLQIENAKDAKKISNLQKSVIHYKRLCQKQKKKLQQYRIMEIQFKKLQSNFNKSQQVRKQQKRIIENLKNRN